MSPESALMSARAYAQHRGVDPKTVRQAIAEGRCPAQRGAGGEWLIDPERADAAWQDRTHPGHGGRREKGKIAVPGTGLLVDPEISVPHRPAGRKEEKEEDELLSYAQSATRLQHYKALLQEIKYLIEIGVLADKTECDQEVFKTYRALRDNLLNLPDRVAAIIASETKPERVRAIITREIEKILGPAEEAPTG